MDCEPASSVSTSVQVKFTSSASVTLAKLYPILRTVWGKRTESLMRATRENMSFLGVSLAVLGLGGGPHWSQMGDIVCLDTDEIGRHDREIAFKILQWDGPILLNYDESDKGKCGVFAK